MVGFTGISLLIKGTMLLMNLHRIVIIVATTLLLALFGCANKVEPKESELPSVEIASTEIEAYSMEPITTVSYTHLTLPTILRV